MDANLKLLKKQDANIKHLMKQTAENNAKDKAITKPQGVRKKQKGVTFCGTRCMCETNGKEKTKEQGGRSSPEVLVSYRKEKKELTDEQKQETQGCSRINGLRPQHATDQARKCWLKSAKSCGVIRTCSPTRGYCKRNPNQLLSLIHI